MKNRQDGIVRFSKEAGAVYQYPQSTIHVSLQVRSFHPHAELSQLGVKNKSNGPVNVSRFPPTHLHAG
jgi:hypothetical protein